MPFTQEQQQEIAKKTDYTAQKERLLKKRKALLDALAYAENDVEEGLIKEERDRLAVTIKELAAKLRQIELWESEAEA